VGLFEPTALAVPVTPTVTPRLHPHLKYPQSRHYPLHPHLHIAQPTVTHTLTCSNHNKTDICTSLIQAVPYPLLPNQRKHVPYSHCHPQPPWAGPTLMTSLPSTNPPNMTNALQQNRPPSDKSHNVVEPFLNPFNEALGHVTVKHLPKERPLLSRSPPSCHHPVHCPHTTPKTLFRTTHAILHDLTYPLTTALPRPLLLAQAPQAYNQWCHYWW